MTPETPSNHPGADDSLIPPSFVPGARRQRPAPRQDPPQAAAPAPRRTSAHQAGASQAPPPASAGRSGSTPRRPLSQRLPQPGTPGQEGGQSGGDGSPRQPRPVPRPSLTTQARWRRTGPRAPQPGPFRLLSSATGRLRTRRRARGAPTRCAQARPVLRRGGGPRPDPAAARLPRQPDAPRPGPSRAARPGGLYPAARTSPSAPSARRPVACWLPVPRRTRGTDVRTPPSSAAPAAVGRPGPGGPASPGGRPHLDAGGRRQQQDPQGRRPLRGHEHPR